MGTIMDSNRRVSSIHEVLSQRDTFAISPPIPPSLRLDGDPEVSGIPPIPDENIKLVDAHRYVMEYYPNDLPIGVISQFYDTWVNEDIYGVMRKVLRDKRTGIHYSENQGFLMSKRGNKAYYDRNQKVMNALFDLHESDFFNRSSPNIKTGQARKYLKKHLQKHNKTKGKVKIAMMTVEYDANRYTLDEAWKRCPKDINTFKTQVRQILTYRECPRCGIHMRKTRHTCPECGFQFNNPPKRKQCVKCGYIYPSRLNACPSCTGKIYCRKCGKSLPRYIAFNTDIILNFTKKQPEPSSDGSPRVMDPIEYRDDCPGMLHDDNPLFCPHCKAHGVISTSFYEPNGKRFRYVDYTIHDRVNFITGWHKHNFKKDPEDGESALNYPHPHIMVFAEDHPLPVIPWHSQKTGKDIYIIANQKKCLQCSHIYSDSLNRCPKCGYNIEKAIADNNPHYYVLINFWKDIINEMWSHGFTQMEGVTSIQKATKYIVNKAMTYIFNEDDESHLLNALLWFYKKRSYSLSPSISRAVYNEISGMRNSNISERTFDVVGSFFIGVFSKYEVYGDKDPPAGYNRWQIIDDDLMLMLIEKSDSVIKSYFYWQSLWLPDDPAVKLDNYGLV